MRFAVAGLLLCFALTAKAQADDNQVSVDAQAGNWVAQSGTDDYGKHLCAAFGEGDGKVIGFKASDGDGLSMRIINHAWSLPPDATGTVELTIGKQSFPLSVVDGSSSLLLANLKPEELRPILDAMDKGSSISVKVGQTKPFVISLSGSTRVVNAFRTCSTNHDFADLGSVDIPGANPFASSHP